MALQFSTGVRNAMLDAIETAAGTSAILKIKSGSAPATCATADSGTVLATINLASDWAAAASGGTKALSSLPVTDTSADATGTAAHFRLYASDGTTCHVQGTVGTSATDLIVDSTSFTSGQAFNITSWTWTAPGA
jgi:UDP-N-acetylmuramyl tripeptide synthase